MKRIVKTTGALVLGAVIMAASSMSVMATERSYTYNYDYWGDVQDSPDTYTVTKVYTATAFGLETNFKSPEGMFVKDDMIYICDTGNNRIVQIRRTGTEQFEVIRIFDSIKGNTEVKKLSGPTDIAISEEGDIFISDKGNARIVRVDQDLNYKLEFGLPVDSTVSAEATFQPSKIVIDTAGRVYCIATGINQGLCKYEADGTFTGFVGATPVTYNWMDYIWKKFATQEQRARMISFVPTSYDNIYMDHEGFIYACAGGQDEGDLDSGAAQAIRKLNLLGSNILVENGEYPAYGDLYWGEGGGYKGPSYYTDVTVMENDIYVCLDRNRGRLFGYDDQGMLVFVFGGNGNMDGYFRNPAAIEHMGHDLLVLDSLDCSVTLFTPTEFGNLIYQAIEQFDAGDYEASGESWKNVMEMNGNYDLAYIGIGRSLLRQERYREAMDYFELKYDADNYSKAYKQYRKEWVEDHIVIIVIVILVLFLVPLSIGRIKEIKHEIDIADIFRT
ncbi:MAG: NHL repeat-containing protein [Acetatifactor sp.]|nr:NHL repeat-containing protein [Acetatifactor sp.]